MTKTTTNLIGIILTILAGTYFFITCCSQCGIEQKAEVTKEAVAPVEPEATSYPFAFSGGDYAYSTNENFNFNTSSSSVLMPVSQDVEKGITGLKSFLAENVNKVININGFYKSDEENNSAFPNLGMARANSVKNYFVSKGISSSLINTNGVLLENLVPKGNIYQGPLEYNLGDRSADADKELKALFKKVNDNPLILQFNTAEASINLSAEQRQKVADISRYLDQVEGSSANVVGHTDSAGNRTTNIRLGQERADFAKAHLMQNGIAESKIKATSKGPDEPIASNATEEGKAKNRRTVITLN